MLLAGLLWIGVGVLLLGHAVTWMNAADEAARPWLVIVGSAAALTIHHLGFLRIVDRNLGRIQRLEGRRCAFSFMPARSYIMVAVMMGMGIGLRHSPIPKPYLAVLYLAIGAALILSSIRYLRVLIQHRPSTFR